MRVRLQDTPLDPSEELAVLRGAGTEAGAMVCFVGTVRSDAARPISSMTIEHYPGMTEAAISGYIEEAMRRWHLLDCLVVHRFGELLPGECIVLVAAHSAHRSDAFRAVDFLMDYLKSRAPFWKKEHTPTGSRWVDAIGNDEDALLRWSE